MQEQNHNLRITGTPMWDVLLRNKEELQFEQLMLFCFIRKTDEQ